MHACTSFFFDMPEISEQLMLLWGLETIHARSAAVHSAGYQTQALIVS